MGEEGMGGMGGMAGGMGGGGGGTPWGTLAMMAAGMLKFNHDQRIAAGQGKQGEVAIRGGQWSNQQPMGYAEPNLWGNLMAAVAGGSQNEDAKKQNSSNSALIAALTKKQGGSSDFDYSVPSSDDFQMPALGGYRRS
jgi:hypothetical protein